MLRAVTARSPGVRTLSLLLTQLGGSNTVSSVVKESNDWDTLKHAHNWFKHYYGTESSSRKEVSGNSWVDTELNKFEEYVKERRVMSLAAVMKNEMLQEELEDDQKHVPVRAGGFEYYIECPGQFPLIYRALSSGIEGQELVLDTTELAELVNETHLEMHAMKISRQGDTLLLLAQAGDSSVVFVRDMASMVTVVQDHILDAMNVEYDANDNIYFTCADELGRPSKVYSVAPIAKGSLDRPEPRLEFEDHDRRYFVGIQRTKDWGYMCINSVSKTSSEVRIVDPNSKQMVVVRQREQHCEYVVEHAHGHLVILSNHEDTLQNQLYFAKISPREDGLQIGTWKPAPYRARKEECFLADVTVHQRACTLLERATNGLPRLRVLPFEHYSNINSIVFGNQYDIPVPEWALDVQFGSNEEFMSDRVEFELQSPILPPVHLEWDLKTKEIYSKGLMDHVTPKLEQYNCIRVPLKSSQGIHIPLTLAYRNDAKNPSKCLFIAYGAYGENLDMSYQRYFFPLLNRDWKIVFVHVRGGGEKGRAWYHAGRTPHKLNSESDLYECIKTLTEKGNIIHKCTRQAIVMYYYC